MGQCSTLPADTRPMASTVATSNMNGQTEGRFSSPVTTREDKKKRLSEGGRKESLDFNVIVTPEPNPRDAIKKDSQKHYAAAVNRSDDVQNENANGLQARDQEQPSSTTVNGAEAMDVDSREQAPPVSLPLLPEGALRSRCYKLNLNSDFMGLSSTKRQQLCLGPFTETPPFLTYSSSEDSCEDISATKVAIRTAQIFRGITVGRDGTILSQNARATRSSRGSKTKRGEKSRQAAKIDKANDLVEEAIAEAKNSEEPTNMVSLIIVGEYDDMKQLVRDGSKKLREAEGLPDEALLSINRSRVSSKPKQMTSSQPSSSRKRSSASPNFVNSQRTAAMQAPEQISVTGQTLSPPKLKSHPRDIRPNRREDRASMRMKLESCSDFMDPRHSGAPGNDEWGRGWNLWNCVGGGAASPLQPSSPNEPHQVVYEGRDAAYGGVREGGVTGRAN